MKKLPYFQFNVLAWLSGNISLFDMREQGVFINICALVWDNSLSYQIEPLLHRRLRLSKADLDTAIGVLCDANIIQRDGDVLSVKFLSEQFDEYMQYLSKKSESGKLGADRRWHSMANKQNRTKQNRKNKKEDKPREIGKAIKAYLDMTYRVYGKRHSNTNLIEIAMVKLIADGIDAERISAICLHDDVILDHFRPVDDPAVFAREFCGLEIEARNGRAMNESYNPTL